MLLQLCCCAVLSVAASAAACAQQGAQSDTYLGASNTYFRTFNPVISQNGLTLTCSVTGSGYQWYLNGVLQGQYTTRVITILGSETGYWKVVVATSGCAAGSDSISVIATSLHETGVVSYLRVFSNPTSANFTAEFALAKPEQFAEITVYDAFGRAVYREKILNPALVVRRDISTENFSAGIYQFELVVESGKKMSRQVEVEK